MYSYVGETELILDVFATPFYFFVSRHLVRICKKKVFVSNSFDAYFFFFNFFFLFFVEKNLFAL